MCWLVQGAVTDWGGGGLLSLPLELLCGGEFAVGDGLALGGGGLGICGPTMAMLMRNPWVALTQPCRG